MRRIDKLGRVVIPLSLRQKYGLTEGVSVEFHDDGDGIIVRAGEEFCRICYTEIPYGVSLPLCESCVTKIIKEYNEKRTEG